MVLTSSVQRWNSPRSGRARDPAPQRPSVGGGRPALRQAARRYGSEDAAHLDGGGREIVDEPVDGLDVAGPAAPGSGDRGALSHLSVAAHETAHAPELARRSLIQRGD